MDHDDVYRAEPLALAALGKIDAVNPDLAEQMASWQDLFDEDMTSEESIVVRYLADLTQRAPELLSQVANLSWLADGISWWETRAVSALYVLALRGEVDFAVELATAPWVVDGVTYLEELFGLTSMLAVASATNLGDHGLEAARTLLSLLHDRPQELDLFVVRSLQTLQFSDPANLLRLLGEPWFVDGLDEQESAYLVAAIGGSATAELFDDYTMHSRTITLPFAGDVRLWAFWHMPLPAHLTELEVNLLDNMETAVRRSEQFWQIPFPIEHVILYVIPTGRRGRHLGKTMLLGPAELQRYTIYHEVGHYYFNEGPKWLLEGGAEVMREYITQKEDVPDPDAPAERVPDHHFSKWCRERGVHNLRDFNAIGGGDTWDGCSYSMGLYFLVQLRSAMGHDVWLEALRAFYLAYGELGLHTVFYPGSPGDQEFYQVVIENTPPELRDEVNRVFETLHGGVELEGEQ